MSALVPVHRRSVYEFLGPSGQANFFSTCRDLYSEWTEEQRKVREITGNWQPYPEWRFRKVVPLGRAHLRLYHIASQSDYKRIALEIDDLTFAYIWSPVQSYGAIVRFNVHIKGEAISTGMALFQCMDRRYQTADQLFAFSLFPEKMPIDVRLSLPTGMVKRNVITYQCVEMLISGKIQNWALH